MIVGKTCKVKPSAGECAMCVDASDLFGDAPDCSKCYRREQRYELLGFSSNLFNDYAIVKVGGVIKKAYLENVYDIREE